MVQTAQYLASQKIPKTIVLTGAMIPYKFGSSDGMFNLGSALAFLQILEPGVYISMNGKIFATNNVRKNLEKGEFETIN
jgi:L-asparaginase